MQKGSGLEERAQEGVHGSEVDSLLARHLRHRSSVELELYFPDRSFTFSRVQVRLQPGKVEVKVVVLDRSGLPGMSSGRCLRQRHGGGRAATVRGLTAPDLLPRGPAVHPIHVATLAIEPREPDERHGLQQPSSACSGQPMPNSAQQWACFSTSQ